MSGFGLRALKKKSAEESQDKKGQFFKDIVVGDDLLSCYVTLRLKENSSSVALISPHALSNETLRADTLTRLNTVRDETLIGNIKNLLPQLSFNPLDEEIAFYKDGKFHSFEGRAQAQSIRDEELIFKNSRSSYDPLALLNGSDWERLEQEVFPKQINTFMKSIELVEPKDMIENAHFKIVTKDNEVFQCHKLHWFASPAQFLSLLENKDDLGEDLHQYIHSLRSSTSLTLHYVLNKQLHPKAATFFLPQSMTYERGYYICEIDAPSDELDSKQCLKVTVLLNEDGLTEEDLVKKIKSIQRILGRIFSEFKAAEKTEKISYRKEDYFINHQDELLAAINAQHPNLKFYGEGAPLRVNNEALNLTRAYLSLEEY